METKIKYQTVYKTSYGIVSSHFKEMMTFEEAEAKGKEYCADNNHVYLKTAESDFNYD